MSPLSHPHPSHRNATRAVWIGIAILVGLQALPFIDSHRHSADEVAFLDAWIGGWSDVGAMTVTVATLQGRLGMFITVPLNIIGAVLSDYYCVRVAFVLLHFAYLALFAFYFSLLSSSRVTQLLLLILVSMHPMNRHDDYMPPEVYPLQNTLPFLFLIASRCLIVYARNRGGLPGLIKGAYCVFFIALLTTEYAFLLGTALIAAEQAFAVSRRWRPGKSLADAIACQVRQRSAWADLLAVILALVAYAAFRLAYPSTYVGNTLDSFDLGRVSMTMLRRVYSGTSLGDGLFPWASLPWYQAAVAAGVGAVTAVAVARSLRQAASLSSPLAICAGAFALMLYVTFPLAATTKQQFLCLDRDACGYLDSRMAYLGVSVVVLSALAALWQWGARGRSVAPLTAVLSLSFGYVGAATYAHNWERGEVAAQDSAPWSRANLLACHPNAQPQVDAVLMKSIDPESRVRFHPDYDRQLFWRRYLQYKSTATACADAMTAVTRSRLEALRPTLVLDHVVQFAAGRGGLQYLGEGWSVPETWAVWSIDDRAELFVAPPLLPGLQLRLQFRPYFGRSVPEQIVSISVNGQHVATFDMKPPVDAECCVRTIPLPSETTADGIMHIVFHIDRPRRPELEPEIPDSRTLGIELKSMVLFR